MPAMIPVRLLVKGDEISVDGRPALVVGVHPQIRQGDRRDAPRTFELCWQHRDDWTIESALLAAEWEFPILRTAAEAVAL